MKAKPGSGDSKWESPWLARPFAGDPPKGFAKLGNVKKLLSDNTNSYVTRVSWANAMQALEWDMARVAKYMEGYIKSVTFSEKKVFSVNEIVTLEPS